VHQKGSKSKKGVLKAVIEPSMVNSLQLRELGVQNTTSCFSLVLASIFSLSLHQCIQQQTKAHIDLQ